MTLPLTGSVPEMYSSDHLLALPRSRGVARPGIEALATAWFPEAGWVSEPSSGPAERPMAGARFRGVVPDDVRRPGVLRLTEGVEVVGPFVVPAPQSLALDLASSVAELWAVRVAHRSRDRLPAEVDDRDGLARVFAAGLPDDVELRVLRWMVAAARKVGGTLFVDGAVPLAPEPAAAVDLTLYSAQALTPDAALGSLQTVVPGARVVEVVERPDRLVDYALDGETAYDGALRVVVRKVDVVPAVLGALDWREYGPFAYRMSWVPADPYELEVEEPSGLHLIARSRMRASVARLASVLQGRAAGVLVDDGGFEVTSAEVDERIAAVSTARFWV
ncbi:MULTISPECIES: hypothetical protein [Oerskovia]|uniref:Uncharacterized protein n=1 Tax=Oerskovia enterophila TaxID=43678 RepID=A0ABX2Y0A4_9CELL|nr:MULTISPECIES: hypothetical protein [Oerskovia]KRC42853.1 hypothetical protein ASE15_02290 [Oerskovia sp. Root22]KRD47011.1 hypothetical protein ASE27_00890 [Oerskovia sp. Root918]OCI29738.1 hypothetical protein OERS_35610 [Oerskovia enterophila]